MELKEKLLNLNIFEDNSYLDKYIELIKINKDTKKEKYKTNKHHIIPRCYYKYNNLEINNSKENTVNILYKDHILAHYYLALCSKDNYFKYANECAIQHLLGQWYIEPSETEFIKSLPRYQELYEHCQFIKSENYKGRKHSEETKLKMSISRRGRKVTDETRKKLSKSLTGRSLSQETKERISKSLVGKKYNITHQRKGTYRIHNNKIEKIVYNEDELNKYISLGWIRGRLPFSEDCKEKMTFSHLGRKQSQEQIEKRRKSLIGKKYKKRK